LRIKVTESGPYIVTGNIPLREVVITPAGNHTELVKGRKLPQNEKYTLCRCGKSKNPPFCDGSHIPSNFIGKETASKEPLLDRIEALLATHECPTIHEFDEKMLGDAKKPEILVVQGPAQKSNAGLFIKGPIVIESSDGTEYKIKGQVALCRCGSSKNKPFCDASHVNAKERG
jgi:CDGSH-type Zn-finger protein